MEDLKELSFIGGVDINKSKGISFHYFENLKKRSAEMYATFARNIRDSADIERLKKDSLYRESYNGQLIIDEYLESYMSSAVYYDSGEQNRFSIVTGVKTKYQKYFGLS